MREGPDADSDLSKKAWTLIWTAEEAIALRDRVKELEECLLEILPVVRHMEDCGPSGESWQSYELEAAIKRCDAALASKESQ